VRAAWPLEDNSNAAIAFDRGVSFAPTGKGGRFQIPSTKFQGNTKAEIPNPNLMLVPCGPLYLVFWICLEFGAWILEFRTE
jgi:hypothetical protein